MSRMITQIMLRTYLWIPCQGWQLRLCCAPIYGYLVKDGRYVVRSGSAITLECRAEGNPPPSISWTMKVRISSPLIPSSVTNSKNILPYTIKLRNPHPSISWTIKVRIPPPNIQLFFIKMANSKNSQLYTAGLRNPTPSIS